MRSLSFVGAAAIFAPHGCAGAEPKGPGPADARQPMTWSERDRGSRAGVARLPARR